MKKFAVLVERAVTFEAALEVEASSEREAERLAAQRAADDMLAWTQVHADTTASAKELGT